MKKSIITLIALFSLTLSTTAFAAGLTLLTAAGGTTVTGTGPQIIGSTAALTAASAGSSLGSLSRGVSLGVNYSTSDYALTTTHAGGSKNFGTAHNATAIYSQLKATTAFAAPSQVDYTAFASGWTVQ